MVSATWESAGSTGFTGHSTGPSRPNDILASIKRCCFTTPHRRYCRLLAVASAQRLSSLPDVPTMAETLPGFESVAWFANVAPPETPKTIVDKINADVNEALRQPEIQEGLRKLSAEIFLAARPKRRPDTCTTRFDRWGK